MEFDKINKEHKKDSIRLADGRVLAWNEWGKSSATPVLFCTGAGMSSSLPFGLSFLDGLNLRLMSVDRPGLGGSDPHPAKTLDTWVEDIKFLFKAQNINSAHVVGFSQGAAFAYALGAAGLSRSMAIVSGQDDFAKEAVIQLLPVEVAGFVERFRTHDIEFIKHFEQTAQAEVLWNLIKTMSSEKDRNYYESEPFQSYYQKCLQEGFSQGAQGYVRDLEITFSAWPFEIETIKSRVDLWYGSLDSSAVHSPDGGVSLSKRLPHSRHFLLADEGGSLLWTQAQPILTELLTK